jgi:hypothetical protein
LELNCRILYELLKDRLHIHPPDSQYADGKIRQILLYTGENCSEDTLYLVLGQKTAESSGMFLYIGEDIKESWCTVCRPEEKMRVVSCILEIFQAFLQWREKCVILAEREHDLQALLLHGVSFLPMAAYVFYDRDYTVHAEFQMEHFEMEEYDMQFLSEGRKCRAMADTALQDLYKEDPEFDKTFQTKGICRYSRFPSRVPGGEVYYCNFFQEEFYLGRLVFIWQAGGETEGLMRLMEYFCSLVEICCQYHYLRQNRRNAATPLEKIWEHLLKRESVNLRETEELLQIYGWKRKNQYQIFCLAPNGYFHSDQTLEFYVVHLQRVFPRVFSMPLEGRIYCLQNLDFMPKEDFHQSLVSFLRENLFKAGFSNIFTDFLEIYRYRCQAEDALSLGNEIDSSIWRYDFADYNFAYIKRQCLRQYPARELCPKNLHTLMEYDRKHPGSELVLTLYYYYTCEFNGQQAAEKLFIHRTTFFYRMNKIQKIASFHPADAEETSHILLAFQLMKEERSGNEI